MTRLTQKSLVLVEVLPAFAAELRRLLVEKREPSRSDFGVFVLTVHQPASQRDTRNWFGTSQKVCGFQLFR